MGKIGLVGRHGISIFFCIVVFQECSSPGGNAYKPSPEKDRSTSIPQADPSLKVEKPGSHSFTVEIKKMKFNPEEITVHKGDTVIWINNDLVTHCITEDKTKAWTSSALPAGASWKKAVSMSSAYYCAIHQMMKGRIKVQ